LEDFQLFKNQPIKHVSGKYGKVKSRGHFPDTIIIEFEDGSETECYFKEATPA